MCFLMHSVHDTVGSDYWCKSVPVKIYKFSSGWVADKEEWIVHLIGT